MVINLSLNILRIVINCFFIMYGGMEEYNKTVQILSIV